MTLNLSELARGGTMCLSKAGLAIGGTASKAKTAAPNGAGVDFAIDGILYHLADADDCIEFDDLTQTDETTCLYLVCVDSSGTITVVQGDEVDNDDLTAGTEVLHWPTPTEDTCAIGAIKIKCDGTAFTGGTTGLDDSDVTDTYYDFMCVPVEPLSS